MLISNYGEEPSGLVMDQVGSDGVKVKEKSGNGRNKQILCPEAVSFN